MNNLKRDIKPGEIVVLKKSLFKPEYQDQIHRLFRVLSGFGLSKGTLGTAIYGKFVEDDTPARQEGHDIDKEETEQYQRGLS